jgi:putative oxidoreductase
MTTEQASGCPFGKITKIIGPNADLPIRLILGAVFIFHGLQKFGFCGAEGDINGFANFIGTLGVPFPLVSAYAAALAELIGGVLVLLGLQTRMGALLLVPPMLVAIFSVHLANGFSAQNGGFEYPLTLLCASLTLMLMGPGCLSIDKALKNRPKKDAHSCSAC